MYYVVDKKKKMNKDRLAEWLKDEGVDEDDIIYLKCRLFLIQNQYTYKRLER